MLRRILSFVLIALACNGLLTRSQGYAQAVTQPGVQASVQPSGQPVSQPAIDTNFFSIPLDSTSGALVSFDHLLSIYEWHGRVNLGTAEIPSAALTNRSSIDTVILLGDSKFLQDDAIRSSSAAGYFYADDASFGLVRPMVTFFGNTIVTSGLPGFSAATLVPGETDGFGVAGIRYLPIGTNLDFAAAGGIAEQKQSGVSNAVGPIVRAMFGAPNELVGEDAMLFASASADERFLNQDNQRYSSDSLALAIANPISGGTPLDSNHAYLNAHLDRRDFFYATDSNTAPVKQEWKELALSLRDSINYPLAGRNLTATVNAALEPSSVERTSDISTSQLSTSSFSAVSSLLVPNEESIFHSLIGGRLDWVASSQWFAQGRMSYDEKTENVLLLGNDLTGLDPSLESRFSTILDELSFETRTTQAGGSISFQPNQKERFQIESDANLLNYDTPSPLNDDDHDELITSASARYDRFFSDELHAWIDIRAARTHLVYLMSDESAQNNVTQSLTLSTHANCSTAGFFAQADGEVFANYTVLDYLDSVPSLEGVGNYVMRGLTLSDSTVTSTGIIPFTVAGPITLQESALLQINERGSYDETNFSEVLASRITQLSGSLTLGLASISSRSPWNVQAGVRAFFLFNDGQSTASLGSGPLYEQLERQTRIGPVLTISLTRWHGIGPSLVGSIWYSVLKDEIFDPGYSISRTPEVEAQLSSQWTF